MHRIFYTRKIRRRGLFGIPYTTLKVRVAHVDDANWRRLKHRPFSITGMMLCGF